MGCGCNKRRKPRPTKPTKDEKAASFELRTASGQTLTFGSRLEAEAAKARRGGAGTIRPV